MNTLFQAGREIQGFLQQQGWAFCFIGGLAVIRWGEVRMTQDIDLSLFSGFVNEEQYIEQLLNHFQSRIPDAQGFAVLNRVLLLSASNGVAVDISLAGLPFEEQMIQRASPFCFTPAHALITCSAEDLIVLKAFADRAKDWGDVEGILLRQGKALDVEYIVTQLAPLCELKENPEILERFHQLIGA